MAIKPNNSSHRPVYRTCPLGPGALAREECDRLDIRGMTASVVIEHDDLSDRMDLI